MFWIGILPPGFKEFKMNIEFSLHSEIFGVMVQKNVVSFYTRAVGSSTQKRIGDLRNENDVSKSLMSECAWNLPGSVC